MQKKLLLIFLLVLCACSAKPYAVISQETFSGTGSNEVYVVSHGWHTGFVVPAKDIQMKIPKLKNRFVNAQYIAGKAQGPHLPARPAPSGRALLSV